MADAVAVNERALAARVHLSLVDEFRVLLGGRPVEVPHSVERILAYLGLAARPVHRNRLAGALWIDASDRLAASSLRTALWRLRRLGIELVETRDGRLALGPETTVDLSELIELARRVRVAPRGDSLVELPRLLERAELLPDWDDDWIVADRERFRLLRLGALEHAADLLLERSELGPALEAALAAIGTEPLRESARRLVVRCHLAEGNVAEALHVYAQYRSLLRDELGVRPSRAMEALVQPLANG